METNKLGTNPWEEFFPIDQFSIEPITCYLIDQHTYHFVPSDENPDTLVTAFDHAMRRGRVFVLSAEFTNFCVRYQYDNLYKYPYASLELIGHGTGSFDTKQHYVVGFVFDETGTEVALIQKTKPAWQAGKYNGIGGKIEEGETPLQAIQREVLEEANLDIDSWQYVSRIEGSDFVVHFFHSVDDFSKLESLTEEKINLFPINNLPKNMIFNLNWLIPLCFDTSISKPIVVTHPESNGLTVKEKK